MIRITEIDSKIDHVQFEGTNKFNATSTEKVSEKLLDLFAAANAKVIIDLSGITYIDSSGFGCFLIAMKAARNNYGTLKLCNLSKDVFSLFRTLQLHTVFEIYNDLKSCVDSFNN